MPTQRRFEGPTLAAVLAKVQKEAGTNPQIVSAQKVRTGGFLGFFQRERFEVVVEISAPAATRAPLPKPPSPTSLLDLAEQTNNTETVNVTAGVKKLVAPAPPVRTASKPEAPAANNSQPASQPEPQSQDQLATQPDLRDPAVRAALLAQARQEREQRTTQPEAPNQSSAVQQPVAQQPAVQQAAVQQTVVHESQPEPINSPVAAGSSTNQDSPPVAAANIPSFAEVLNRLAFQQPPALASESASNTAQEPDAQKPHTQGPDTQEPAVDETPEADAINLDDSQRQAFKHQVDDEVPEQWDQNEWDSNDQPLNEGGFERNAEGYDEDPDGWDDEDPDEASSEWDDEPNSTEQTANHANATAHATVHEPLVAKPTQAKPEHSPASTGNQQASVPAQRTRVTDAPLAKLGLPALYVRELPETKEAAVLQRAIAGALRDLPKAPEVTPSRGSVIAVVGERNEAEQVAKDLLVKWHRPQEEVVIAAQRWPAPAETLDDSQVIRSVNDAENCQRSWSRRKRPTIVVIDAPLGSTGTSWAEHILEALEPIATYCVADATRKSEDISAWIQSVGGADAIALNHVAHTVSPASVLATEVPVDRIDGKAASAELWAMLLTERLMDA